MLQTIINTAEPILIAAVVGILTTIITVVGNAVIKLVTAKIEAVKVKVGADKLDASLKAAKAAYAIVDEKFRITPALTKTIASAQAMFAIEIKKLIPAVTDTEIESLRQAVAGEVNAGKAAIEAEVAPTTTEPETDTTITDAVKAAVNLLVSVVPSTSTATETETEGTATAEVK